MRNLKTLPDRLASLKKASPFSETLFLENKTPAHRKFHTLSDTLKNNPQKPFFVCQCPEGQADSNFNVFFLIYV